MPQYDLYHDAVKRALVKDGWTITDDPFTLEYDDLRLYADLGAEKLFAAIKQTRRIVVEVKVFGGVSLITELQKTLGQYGMYRSIIRRIAPERTLYLAVTQDVYQDFFRRPAIKDIVSDHRLEILTFDPDIEEVLSWIN
ncbi:MAG: element excision factor XisH family protein [Cyanobacteria bacterium P01_F01_bin.150]